MYAIYIDSGHISGAERRALKLFSELNRNGIHCKLILSHRLFTLFAAGEYKRYLDKDNCIVINSSLIDKLRNIKGFHYLRRYTGFNRLTRKIYHLQAINLLKESEMSFSILHIFLDLNLASQIGKLKNVNKILFEITSPDYVKKLSSYQPNDLVKIDYFNAVSESTYIGSVDFIPKDKVYQAPIPFFDPEYILNKDKLWSQKENVIIFAHRLILRKNGILFAKVVKQFLKHYSHWKIKIFGKGPESTEINNLLSEEISLGQVITGYQTKILSELERSKIFVSLTEPDNYPSQSVLEAMYAGNALLLSNRGFTREKFFLENGMLCEISFEDVLCELIKLVNNETDLEYFGNNSRSLLDTRYSKESYISYMCQMYDSIAQS